MMTGKVSVTAMLLLLGPFKDVQICTLLYTTKSIPEAFQTLIEWSLYGYLKHFIAWLLLCILSMDFIRDRWLIFNNNKEDR